MWRWLLCLALVACSGPTEKAVDNPRGPATFFVSSSTGNDTNSGLTSGAPWQTLARLSSQTFVPGDVISLKAGDTFTGHFVPAGSGTVDAGLHASTFSSTYTSQKAAYVAGSQYTTKYNAAIAAGMTTTLADTAATDYCGMLATRDALDAADTAMDGSANTKWITLTSYGAGANPIIDATGFNAAVDWPSTCTGGWKVTNIDVKNALAAGFHMDTTSAYGAWFDNCNASDIDGMTLPVNSNTPQVPGFHNAWPAGFEFYAVSGIHMHSCTAKRTGTPMMAFAYDKVRIDNCTFDVSKYQSAWFVGFGGAGPYAKNCAITSTQYTNMGQLGWPFGTASLAVSDVDTFVLLSSNIGSQTHHDGDAEAFDVEGVAARILVEGCTIHDTYGSAMQFLLGSKSNVIISGNTFTNCGNSTPLQAILIKQNAFLNYCFHQGNTITRVSLDNSQKLYADTSHPEQGSGGYYSDTPPATCYFSPDNSVTPP